jgi:signal transduction histidine kinase
LGVRTVDDETTGTLCVEVTDDGIGTSIAMASAALSAGRGLDDMRQRARSLDGGAELVARPRGTCVRPRIASDPRSEPDAHATAL